MLSVKHLIDTYSLTADDIDNIVNQLSTLSVVTLSPVVTSTRLAEDEVVGTEQLTERTGTDGVHGTGLKVNQHSTGNVLLLVGLLRESIFVFLFWIFMEKKNKKIHDHLPR